MSEDYEPDLDITKLHEVHAERERNKRLVFETIYLRCREKILYANDAKHKTTTWYRIPSIIWGLPMYNIQACAAYLMYRLRLQKFKVTYHSPNTVLIDWSEIPDGSKRHINKIKEVKYDKGGAYIEKEAKKLENDEPIVLHGLSKLHRVAQRLKYGNQRCPPTKTKY